MDNHPPSALTGPASPGSSVVALSWVIAAAWPIGTMILFCLAWGTVYNGLLDAPGPPTTSSKVLSTTMLVWMFLLPAIGLPISAQRHNWVLAAVFATELALAIGCGYLYGFGTHIWI